MVFMKNNLVCLTLLIVLNGALPCQGVEVNASLDRRTASVGEAVPLTLSVEGREQPRLLDQKTIKNMRWLKGGSNTSVSIINGRAQTSVTYFLQPLAEGMLQIPPLDVAVGRTTAKTPPLRLRVVKGDDVAVSGDSGTRQVESIKDIVFGRGEILTESTEFYVGEEIPLEIKLFYPRDLNCEPTSWPEIKQENIIFKDFGARGAKNNSSFEPPTRDLVKIEGRLFNVYTFRTAFRCIAPGVLQPTAVIPTEIKIPERRQRGTSLFGSDDFFDGFFGGSRYRSIAHAVKIKFPELEIKELPSPPEQVHFLGLVGNWHVGFELPDEKYKTGEPFTLKMEVKGIGTLDTLTVPQLELEGFRVYPPEIAKSQSVAGGNQHVAIKYVFIPTKTGSAEIKLNVAIFSAPLHKYQEFSFNKKIEIEDSPFAATTPTSHSRIVEDDDPGAGRGEANKEQLRSSILYLKTRPSGRVAIPLYENWLLLYILLGIAGPLAWFVSEFIRRRHVKLNNNTALRRRKAALAGRSGIIKSVNRASSEDMSQVVQKEVVPYLNDILNLPPGTDVSTLAKKVDDPDLTALLKGIGESSYMPGATNDHNSLSKKNIIKALKRAGMVFLAICFALSVGAQTVEEKTPIHTFTEALNAYDRGDFKLAADFFRRQIDAESPDPALLYNLGNCMCQLEDYPGALVCFERSRLLDPIDSAVTENLNFVRRKLFLPEVGVVRHPGDLLMSFRDLLRPDQWLLAACIIWFLMGVLLAFRSKLSGNKMAIMSIICCFIFSLCVVAYLTQKRGNYSSANAVVVVDNTELRGLPSHASGKTEMRLRGGARVQIVEPRMEWVRINVDGCEGWVHRDDIISIAPGGRIP